MIQIKKIFFCSTRITFIIINPKMIMYVIMMNIHYSISGKSNITLIVDRI